MRAPLALPGRSTGVWNSTEQLPQTTRTVLVDTAAFRSFTALSPLAYITECTSLSLPVLPLLHMPLPLFYSQEKW